MLSCWLFLFGALVCRGVEYVDDFYILYPDSEPEGMYPGCSELLKNFTSFGTRTLPPKKQYDDRLFSRGYDKTNFCKMTFATVACFYVYIPVDMDERFDYYELNKNETSFYEELCPYNARKFQSYLVHFTTLYPRGKRRFLPDSFINEWIRLLNTTKDFKTCYSGKGYAYTGDKRISYNDKECVPWKNVLTGSNNWPVVEDNFCRNFRYSELDMEGPYCYILTRDRKLVARPCGIDLCLSDSEKGFLGRWDIDNKEKMLLIYFSLGVVALVTFAVFVTVFIRSKVLVANNDNSKFFASICKSKQKSFNDENTLSVVQKRKELKSVNESNWKLSWHNHSNSLKTGLLYVTNQSNIYVIVFEQITDIFLGGYFKASNKVDDFICFIRGKLDYMEPEGNFVSLNVSIKPVCLETLDFLLRRIDCKHEAVQKHVSVLVDSYEWAKKRSGCENMHRAQVYGLVTEFSPYGTVEVLFSSEMPFGRKLTNLDRLDIMREVLSGLDALHKAGFVHGDLSIRNCHLYPPQERMGSFHVKIADDSAGSMSTSEKYLSLPKCKCSNCKKISNFSTLQRFWNGFILPVRWTCPEVIASVYAHCCKTVDFANKKRSSELLESIEYRTLSRIPGTFAGDIWSYGILAYELYHYNVPIFGNDLTSVAQKLLEISHRSVAISDELTHEVRFDQFLTDIMLACCHPNPSQRWSLEELSDRLIMESDEN